MKWKRNVGFTSPLFVCFYRYHNLLPRSLVMGPVTFRWAKRRYLIDLTTLINFQCWGLLFLVKGFCHGFVGLFYQGPQCLVKNTAACSNDAKKAHDVSPVAEMGPCWCNVCCGACLTICCWPHFGAENGTERGHQNQTNRELASVAPEIPSSSRLSYEGDEMDIDLTHSQMQRPLVKVQEAKPCTHWKRSTTTFKKSVKVSDYFPCTKIYKFCWND